jgi:hypothetical protein
MMLTLVVLAGDTVPVSRQIEVAALTTAVLILGFFASLMTETPVKLMFFGTGVGVFSVLAYIVERNVRDHSGGTESLFQVGHGSPYKALCLKVVSTWVLFPIWWLFSAEGLNIVSKPEYNTLISAALNIMAKGVYVVFVDRIYVKYLGEESLMAHPCKKPHDMQYALERASRLGPAGAIQATVKSIEKEEKQMEYIRNFMLSIDSKNAAEFLVSSEAPSMSRTKSTDDRSTNSGDDYSNYPDCVSEDHVVIECSGEAPPSAYFNGHKEALQSASSGPKGTKDIAIMLTTDRDGHPRLADTRENYQRDHQMGKSPRVAASRDNHQGDHQTGRVPGPLSQEQYQREQQMARKNEGVGRILTDTSRGGVSKPGSSDGKKIRRERSHEITEK